MFPKKITEKGDIVDFFPWACVCVCVCVCVCGKR